MVQAHNISETLLLIFQFILILLLSPKTTTDPLLNLVSKLPQYLSPNIFLSPKWSVLSDISSVNVYLKPWKDLKHISFISPLVSSNLLSLNSWECYSLTIWGHNLAAVMTGHQDKSLSSLSLQSVSLHH